MKPALGFVAGCPSYSSTNRQLMFKSTPNYSPGDLGHFNKDISIQTRGVTVTTRCSLGIYVHNLGYLGICVRLSPRDVKACTTWATCVAWGLCVRT